MRATTACFIKNAPLRSADWFTGPFAWFTPCGSHDIDRHIVESASAFKAKGVTVVLLFGGVVSGDYQFLYRNIQSYSLKNQNYSSVSIEDEVAAQARHIVKNFIEGASQKFQDRIILYTTWLVRLKPRLIQIWSDSSIDMLLSAIISGVPNIIITGRDIPSFETTLLKTEGIDERFLFSILSNTLRLPHVVMTNYSRAGCRAYEAWLGLMRGTVSFTPRSFDPNLSMPTNAKRMAALREKLKIPETASVLGGIFHATALQTLELWVKTALRACATNSNLYAVLVGEGATLETIQATIAGTAFKKRILFPGIIEDKSAFFQLCTVFLDTTHGIAPSDILFDVQAAAVPILVPPRSAAAVIVKESKCGFVANEEDEVSLAEYVKFLLKHDDIAHQAGQCGRNYVISEYDPSRSLACLWRVYTRLLPEECISVDDAFKENMVTFAEQAQVGDGFPLVSIVLPTYNHLTFLPKAVESILAQDYPNYELIIVDDGSSDGTHDYLESLSYAKIRTLSGPNTRLPTALNRGFALARGEYLTWTSADNICLPHFCGMLVKALQAYPQADFATAPFALINEQGFVIDKLESKVSLDRMLANNVGVAAFMYRSDIAQQVGLYNPDLEGAEDWDMWLRLLEVTTAVHVPYTLYHYRCHSNSLTATISDKVRSASICAGTQALQRMEKRGGVKALFPQISLCKNKELALFHANFVLGSRILQPSSFVKGFAAKYLGAAYALRPDDLAAMGNYAVALAWHGRWKEAENLFRNGEARASEQFAFLRDCCIKQRRHTNTYFFCCPTFALPTLEESELLQQITASQLSYTNF